MTTTLRDLQSGVAFADLTDGGMLAGQVQGEEVLLLRRGDELFAIGAHCTHYHGPLAEGLVVGDTVRCPWHHACFNLRTGEALRAPALDSIPCWRVERVGDKVFVREKVTQSVSPPAAKARGLPESVVIVGGGAAGLAAAEMLRREGYGGALTMVSADDSPPCDRPNLSKDFLAGTAPEEWMPLRPPEFYTDHDIQLLLSTRVLSLDVHNKRLQLEGGKSLEYGAALLATGADPIRLQIPGATPDQIHYLRTFADSRAIIARVATAKSVVILGTSFIGLEVAASLRARGVDVHVVGQDAVPLERVLGAELGGFVQALHEDRGVVFHLRNSIARVDGRRVTLTDATTLDADFVVLGVGVRPATGLAEQAGLATDKGVAVDEYLQTSAPGVFAAGDIARWPDPHSGERLRIEHWVVALRQGQVAAQNIMGRRQRFEAVPFFWSHHYDISINYVGHAQRWDSIEIEGSLGGRAASVNCAAKYQRGGRTLAVATISRDLRSLQAELEMESLHAGNGDAAGSRGGG
jgi:NADPH-dependent 2,4-dienoyl-CoA reductase/sulfur reductase-like enzyme/nitrite reductase/ring-hydroxylating ferredoxin subunit